MATIYNNFVINPESFWTPAYRISPFHTGVLPFNNSLLEQAFVDEKLLHSYFGDRFIFLENGKSAINKALAYYELNENDEVWIETTSGNKYISSCVTSEIEKFCKWSRSKSEKTKVIFINHEFGFCHRELAGLKRHNLPIIEDRALSFASVDEKGLTGTVGDFVIYSLPKFFPVNYGGVLQVNIPVEITAQKKIPYLDILISFYLTQSEEIKRKRTANFLYLSNIFQNLGMSAFFNPLAGEAPGVFMFSGDINFSELKPFMQKNGVESSIFYGRDAFFLPVHQNLSERDMDFFFSLVKYFKLYGAK